MDVTSNSSDSLLGLGELGEQPPASSRARGTVLGPQKESVPATGQQPPEPSGGQAVATLNKQHRIRISPPRQPGQVPND